MKRFLDAGLYLVTSQALSAGRSTEEIVKAAISGGVRLIQLREKAMPARDFLSLAKRVRALTARSDALLIINDRLDIALASGADGVHFGQDDLSITDARRIAPGLIVGASTHSVREARRAQKEGASYINIGPLFPTQTKAWGREFLGIRGLRRILPSVRIPFTVMGGIKPDHIPTLAKAGVRTIAVVTAVTLAPAPAEAARALREQILSLRRRA